MLRKTPESMSQRILDGIFWTFSATIVRGVIEIFVVATLARLLLPREFGVVAAALVLVKFSAIFSQFGIGPAIVQRPNLEVRHIRTGHTLSCIFGFLLLGLISLLAPVVADFFRMKELIRVLRVMSLVFPVQGISLMAEFLLQRQLKFRSLACIQTISFAVGYGCIGLCLAFMGFGLWSLVWAHLSQVSLKGVILLVIQPHPKKPKLERLAVKDLLYFGSGFTVARFFNSVAGYSDNLVIGRWLGAEALGLYGRAYQLMAMPAMLIGTALDKVLFSAMASFQDNLESLRLVYKRGVALIAMFILPTSVVMYVLSAEIITVLFGPAWLEADRPFKILALGMLFRTSFKMSDSLVRATGAVYRRAWRQGLYALSAFGGAWCGHFFGLSGVAFGILIAMCLNFLFMTKLSLDLTLMSWREFISAHVPAILLTTIVLAEVHIITFALSDFAFPAIIVLFMSFTIIIVSIFFFLYLVPNHILGEDVIWLLKIVLNYIPRRYHSLIIKKQQRMK